MSDEKPHAEYFCERLTCKSDKPGTVAVYENIGDGSWRTMICEDCANELGLKEGDDINDRREPQAG